MQREQIERNAQLGRRGYISDGASVGDMQVNTYVVGEWCLLVVFFLKGSCGGLSAYGQLHTTYVRALMSRRNSLNVIYSSLPWHIMCTKVFHKNEAMQAHKMIWSLKHLLMADCYLHYLQPFSSQLTSFCHLRRPSIARYVTIIERWHPVSPYASSPLLSSPALYTQRHEKDGRR